MARRRWRWYSLSLDTLRGWVRFVGALVLVATALFAYRLWETHALRGQAAEWIAEARGIEAEVLARGEAPRFAEELSTGRQLLRDAREAYRDEQYRRASDFGRRSRNVLGAILELVERGGARGEAHFIAVQGGVEMRRGGAGAWQTARTRETLRPGDAVRTTANGSAEIMFSDGTLFTLRPSTFLAVPTIHGDGGGEQSVEMGYGWLNLATARHPSRVTTPRAEARVAQDSEAFVTYDRDSGRGRFGAIRGGVEVSTEEGARRRVGPLEQVVQVGGGLSAARRLPPAPRPLSPQENAEIDPARTSEMVLEWAPVDGAAGYTLQVARNRLFVDNVIEDSGRRRASARLGIRGEGSFQWRVAAETGDGGQGPWSEPRSFRVAAFGVDGAADGAAPEPPSLEILATNRYGSIFIVEGRTDPGAIVEVDGEPVSVNAAGSFSKTTQLVGEGWSFIVVRSRDAWGSVTEKRLRVYLENP